jgi:carbon monoxide dehydrogenase subunit G
MIRLDGTHVMPRPLATTASKINDPRFLVQCLPNLTDVSADTTQAKWKLRPSLSFLSGTLDGELSVLSTSATGAQMKLVSKGIGASATTLITVGYESADANTNVKWTVEITELTGLLKLVPKGLIQGTAQKEVEKGWQAVASKLASEA